MRRGPKGDVDESPLPFRPRKTGVERFAAFVSRYLIVPKSKGAGKGDAAAAQELAAVADSAWTVYADDRVVIGMHDGAPTSLDAFLDV